MTLQPFEMSLLKNQVQIDEQEVRNFVNEDQFMKIAVDLLIEIGEISVYESNIHPLDTQLQPRKWARNEAILAGLMVRLTKIQVEILDSNQRLNRESVSIFVRCLSETAINLIYLLQKGSIELFDHYVQYSLMTEKDLLDRVDENIAQRDGIEQPIEKRMKASIEQSFIRSGMKASDIVSKKQNTWCQLNLYDRAKAVNFDQQYIAIFSLPCHEVHGNWQDLIEHHLSFKDGEFSPKPGNLYPRPQAIQVAALFSAYACEEYLLMLPESPVRDQLKEHIGQFIEKIRAFSQLHEEFLAKKTPCKI